MNNMMMQQFMQFKQNFRGNAQQQIQQMLNSGKISQEQYNQAVQYAQQMRGMFNQQPQQNSNNSNNIPNNNNN